MKSLPKRVLPSAFLAVAAATVAFAFATPTAARHRVLFQNWNEFSCGLPVVVA